MFFFFNTHSRMKYEESSVITDTTFAEAVSVSVKQEPTTGSSLLVAHVKHENTTDATLLTDQRIKAEPLARVSSSSSSSASPCSSVSSSSSQPCQSHARCRKALKKQKRLVTESSRKDVCAVCLGMGHGSRFCPFCLLEFEINFDFSSRFTKP